MADIILAIETSNPTAHRASAGVALARRTDAGIEVIGEESVREGPRLDDDLVPAIERVCERAGVRAPDLGMVAVSVGPGGYTSIRVGVAAAAMIARAAGARVCAVPTALCAAWSASAAVPAGSVVAVCLAWKGETVWRHRFRAGDPPVAQDAGGVVGVGALDAREMVVADETFAGRVRDDPALAGVEVVPMRLSAASVARASAHLVPTDAALVGPIYPREPEAVTKWRALGRGSAR